MTSSLPKWRAFHVDRVEERKDFTLYALKKFVEIILKY